MLHRDMLLLTFSVSLAYILMVFQSSGNMWDYVALVIIEFSKLNSNGLKTLRDRTCVAMSVDSF